GNLFISGGIIIKVASDGTLTTVYNGTDAWPMAFDKLGNLFFAINPIGPSTIEKVAPDGTISPFVKFTGPGESVTGLAFDKNGNLFARRGGTIDEIFPDGTVTTFASGDFNYPLAFDTSGNLFANPNSFEDDTPCLLKFSPDGTST